MSEEAATNQNGGVGDNADAPADEKGSTTDYAHIGETFATWLNGRLRKARNPTIMLGTKRAIVLELTPEGALRCAVETDGPEAEEQLVAFEEKYLVELLRNAISY